MSTRDIRSRKSIWGIQAAGPHQLNSCRPSQPALTNKHCLLALLATLAIDLELSDISIYIRSKAIYCTNYAGLIACMQAEVVSTGMQKLPQLRPLAEITWSSENVLFVPNCNCTVRWDKIPQEFQKRRCSKLR